jgi:hypothetical protein
MNLQRLRSSRKKPVAGDIFALHPVGRDYYFGRVIMVGTRVVSLPGNLLIYLYDAHGAAKESVPDLRRDRLLVAPMVTNRLPFSKGYFEVVASRPLGKDDVLPVHCFRSSSGKYFDEQRRPLRRKVRPCGELGLHSFRTIDDAVSEALGIPLACD